MSDFLLQYYFLTWVTTGKAAAKIFHSHNMIFCDLITFTWGQDKTANFKVGQNRQFCERDQIAIKIVCLMKASWPIYRQLEIILPNTIRK